MHPQTASSTILPSFTHFPSLESGGINSSSSHPTPTSPKPLPNAIVLVRKEDGRTEPFQGEKILASIKAAMKSSVGFWNPNIAIHIVQKIEKSINKALSQKILSNPCTQSLNPSRALKNPPTPLINSNKLGSLNSPEKQIDPILISSSQLATQVEAWLKTNLDKSSDLTNSGNPNLATALGYKNYKYLKKWRRCASSEELDRNISSILQGSNIQVRDENSNKNAAVIATQRDLIAGELSKYYARRKLLPLDIALAHDLGAIHVHDLDYFLQPMFNCCLVNLEDMLNNGTCINGKQIDPPKSFQVACTVTTQIIAQVASGQYGGQSINGIDRIIAPFVAKSFAKHLKNTQAELSEIYQLDVSSPSIITKAKEAAWRRTRKEIADGIQTIQYQINTIMTTNGQAPFVTLCINFSPDDPYAFEASLVCEEILQQRLKGIKNSSGVYVTPAFPKLIYVLDVHNAYPNSRYYQITALAAKCSAARMYPDYISAKMMRKLYAGQVFSPMGCRSFLSPWQDKTGKYIIDGRFNMGVVSLNLPQIAILSQGNETLFWTLLDKRLELAKAALLLRYERLKSVTSDVSPIHWQHGAIARLKPGESIAPLLKNGYATISLGYIGIYEATKLLKGCSHTQSTGKTFALKIMDRLETAVKTWKAETGLGFALYGTPAESLTHRFCQLDTKHFGMIPDVTDKGFYTNSYHVDVREPINIFDKFTFEAEFQQHSLGGMISYAEIPNLTHNPTAIEKFIQFIYEHITYAEFNTKLDYCHCCGYRGEMVVNEQTEWQCPQCQNQNRQTLTVIRRTCGYLGENFWTTGRTKEIAARVLHI